MATNLPELYFRVRENGAVVFRVDTGNRQQRIELDQIAVVNIRNGDIKPQGDRALSNTETAAIRDWMAERATLLARRDMDDIHRTIDHLNLTTQWAHARATEAELDEVADRLLLAMHDLRAVLVRKKSEKLRKDR